MIRFLPLAVLIATPLLARDPRIATRLYNPSDIVTVHGHTGIQSTIEFGDDEHIDNIAIGDSSSWQVTPNKHASIVFVKPMMTSARTNMTVVTDRRTYLFDLVATPVGTPLYVMRFTYPPNPRPVVAIAPPAAPTQLTPQVAEKTPETTPADLHFDWATSGSKQLLPMRAFDDGKSTWLAWPKDASMPAILQREPDGQEGPVNYRVQGDYVVVDGVPPQLVLRQGKLVATLAPALRRASDPPSPAGAQTASARP
ncbi:TrbG/VirB9 family P-type conjugative transfer protein [Sphingomonas oryzagri]